MTESESVMYRVVPKCACSSIGQIMYYSDHGVFFDGDIHDSKDKLHKWAQEDSQPLIEANAKAHKSYAFTCVATRLPACAIPTPASYLRSSIKSAGYSATASDTAATLFRS